MRGGKGREWGGEHGVRRLDRRLSRTRAAHSRAAWSSRTRVSGPCRRWWTDLRLANRSSVLRRWSSRCSSSGSGCAAAPLTIAHGDQGGQLQGSLALRVHDRSHLDAVPPALARMDLIVAERS
eukprot:4780528-Pleurochrysis_carterae.AAC.1